MRLPFALALVLLPLAVAAQNPQAILDASRAKMNGFNDITVEFRKTVRYVNGSEAPAIEGTLIMKKKKFILHIAPLDVYCNTTTLWQVDNQAKEVTVSAYDADEGLSPDRIFTISQDDMRTQYAGAEAIGGKQCHKIVLFPLASTDYVSITVWIDQAAKLPRQMLTKYKNGSKVTYTMKTIVSDKQIDDAAFTLNPTQRYPTYTVEDLR
jgi:outer membrane lipoprotein-sorting protein